MYWHCFVFWKETAKIIICRTSIASCF
jgi:hypothetical protein